MSDLSRLEPEMPRDQREGPDMRETPPAFNLPGVIVLLGAVMIAIHGVRTGLLPQAADFNVLERFAFVPGFYDAPAEALRYPMARFWTPMSHAFLHGDWTHLLVNLVWMAAFGGVVAARFGAFRFLIFFAVGSAAGALAHYFSARGDLVPLIGASGAVSACMGAAIRFAFGDGRMAMRPEQRSSAPAMGLVASLANRNIMIFVGVWFLLNWLLGSGILPIAGGDSIAWQAHVGGFALGWLGFAIFDPLWRDRVR
ncbi:MAG: rhomboid family intramembrane serine protease [Pseudomonadota bacterium]